MVKPRFNKTTLKIIAACALAIFPLLPAAIGTYAWFSYNTQVHVTGGQFTVATMGEAKLHSANLIKFDYCVDTFGTGVGAMTVTDYLNPERGMVNSYDYNESTHNFEDESSNVVNVMNMYDPVDYLINGYNLASMYCNAVYRLEMETTFFTDAVLTARVEGKSEPDGYDSETQILLSSCLDFDIFYEEDLDDDNPLFFSDDTSEVALQNNYNNKAYIPSFKNASNGKYYAYDTDHWAGTVAEPSGTYKGTINYLDFLSPSEGDYYQIDYSTAAYGNYFQWDGSQWNEEESEPEGHLRTPVDFQCDLPESPTAGDCFKVAYKTTVSGKFYQWNGSSWGSPLNDEPSTGTYKGKLRFDIHLPTTDGYYRVLYEDVSLTEAEEIYYKFSHLANQKGSHAHLYPTADTSLATDVPVTFVENLLDEKNYLTLYLNVNYSPEVLEAYSTRVYTENIDALYDFAFRFIFAKEASS